MEDDNEQLTPTQRAYIALKQMRAKLDAIEQANSEPIAIIGMGCRFPGGADNPASYWKLLREGVDAVAEIPPDRWDVEAYYDPDQDRPGKMYTRWGGYLKSIDKFDPQFFGISPREAERMDPQQRLALEVAWEALEDAAQSVEQLAHDQTGVFLGIGQNDYAQMRLYAGDAEQIDVYDGTGNGLCFASGRLSYALGLRGPNLALDTACSSSLVAVHLACQSLRNKECRVALAGGVHLSIQPAVGVFLSRAKALAPDGSCKAFDAAADGFGRGEGCGMIVLKRLSDAVRDGDRVVCVIRGSAVNHNGKSSGITVPNVKAQANLIRDALRNAKAEAEQISYVEAHGTGTLLGDPIEIEALASVFHDGRPKQDSLLIGSVKTNLGHLEAASGIAGLIKVALALQHREIPAQLHFNQPNPRMDWDHISIRVAAERSAWPSTSQLPMAGVSSFGISGTNAHVVLQAAEAEAVRTDSLQRPLHVLTLSAASESALSELAGRFERWFAKNLELDVADVCFTINSGRTQQKCRRAFVGALLSDFRHELSVLHAGQHGSNGASRIGDQPPTVGFLFTGQGSQYLGMGRQLYETQPTFRDCLDRCAGLLRPHLDLPLLDVLYTSDNKSSLIDETAYTQPALFALEYAMAKLWKSWGIEPAAVMGHSLGEYVAACVAGVFSLEDCLEIVCHRARLLQSLPASGEMVCIFAGEELVMDAIRAETKYLSIAAVNSPSNVVVSGRREPLRSVVAGLEARGFKTKQLNVSHAFHSPLIEPVLAEFRDILSRFELSPPIVELISNITGQPASADITDPEYWVRHMRQPVKFSAGAHAMVAAGCQVFLEIGPRPILVALLGDVLTAQGVVLLPTLRQGQEDWVGMLEALAELYVRGVPVDWQAFDAGYSRRRVSLPTYPFQRKRYWLERSKTDRHLPETINVVDSLINGDVDQLIELLNASKKFNADELSLAPKILRALAEEYQRQTFGATCHDWFYRLQWHAGPHLLQSFDTQPPQFGTWLVLADKGPVGRQLAELLRKRGQTCLLAVAQDRFQRIDTQQWTLNLAAVDDFERMIDDIEASSSVPLTGIIDLWALDWPSREDTCAASLDAALHATCTSALHLIGTLVRRQIKISRGVWLVTRNAVSVGEDDSQVAVSQALLWGLGQVLTAERPELLGGMIDLTEEFTEQDAPRIFCEIWQAENEDQITLREHARYVARLHRCEVPQQSKVEIRPDASYLITGGLGLAGWAVANALVQRGAKQIWLTSRRGVVDANQKKTLDEYKKRGVEIELFRADVSNESSMARLFDQIRRSDRPLKGIIHAAGVLGHEPIQDIGADSLAAVTKSKVQGTWLLHELSLDLQLDFFVCFSSIASLWGSKNQAHYAAANAFVDSMAQYRRSQGLPGMAINWGPWRGGGMTSPEAEALLARMGVRSLPVGLAQEALFQLLGCRYPQIAVADIDWSVFTELFSVRRHRPLFEVVAPGAREPMVQSEATSSLRSRIKGLSPAECLDELIAFVRTEVASIMKFEASQLPEPKLGFAAMGMDSLMALELRNRVQRCLDRSLPATIAFDYPNVERLAAYLAQEISEQPRESGERQDSPYDEPIGLMPDAADLGNEELEKLIAQKIEAIESLMTQR